MKMTEIMLHIYHSKLALNHVICIARYSDLASQVPACLPALVGTYLSLSVYTNLVGSKQPFGTLNGSVLQKANTNTAN